MQKEKIIVSTIPKGEHRIQDCIPEQQAQREHTGMFPFGDSCDGAQQQLTWRIGQ